MNHQFDQWRKTGRDVADVCTELRFSYGDDIPIPGRVYAGGLYLERNVDATRDPNVNPSGEWCVMLERDEYYGSLQELEFRLFLYGVDAHAFDDIDLT